MGEWPLERVLILFVSVAFLLMGIQVTLYHYRQNFHQKSMWVPVIASPLFFFSGLALALFRTEALEWIFITLMGFGVLAGAIGFYKHFKGVGVRVGGYELRNFMIGPPVILPLMFAALSALGIISVWWK